TPRVEVWRGLEGASSFLSRIGKIVIAISDDIDPSSVDAILWSMAYRCNPKDDIQIKPLIAGGQGSRVDAVDSGLLIDATRKRPMPPLALPSKEIMEDARKIWE